MVSEATVTYFLQGHSESLRETEIQYVEIIGMSFRNCAVGSFLTGSGSETSIIFHEGVPLPHFVKRKAIELLQRGFALL